MDKRGMTAIIERGTTMENTEINKTEHTEIAALELFLAMDTVNQDKLLEVMREMVKKNQAS